LLIEVRRAFEATKNQAQKNQAQKSQLKTGETP